MKKKTIWLMGILFSGLLTVNALARPADNSRIRLTGAADTISEMPEASSTEDISVQKNADESLSQVEVDVVFGQDEARKMLETVNDFRTDTQANWYWNEDNTSKVHPGKLSELKYDYELERLAMQRAAELAVSYDHVRPDGEYVFTEEEETTDYWGMGENIAYGYNSLSSGDSVFTAWREENDDYSGQGHRRNMLSEDFSAVGIGYATIGGYHFWVQVFGGNGTVNDSFVAANNSETTVTVNVLCDSIADCSIIFSEDKDIELKVGETAQIPDAEAIVTVKNSIIKKFNSGAQIVYSVSDSSVASLNDKQLKGLKKGNTNLIAKATAGCKSVSETKKITVTEADSQQEGQDPSGETDDQGSEDTDEELLPSIANLDFEFTSTDGEKISSKSSGKEKMLVFCTTTCSSCVYLFNLISASPESYKDYEIIAVVSDCEDMDEVKSYQSKYGDSIPVTFCQDTSDSMLGAIFDYKYAVDNSYDVGTPLCILINKDNRIIDYCEGGKADLIGWMQESFSKKYEKGDDVKGDDAKEDDVVTDDDKNKDGDKNNKTDTDDNDKAVNNDGDNNAGDNGSSGNDGNTEKKDTDSSGNENSNGKSDGNTGNSTAAPAPTATSKPTQTPTPAPTSKPSTSTSTRTPVVPVISRTVRYVIPGAVTIKKAKCKYGMISLKWKKISDVDGYEVQIASNSFFTKNKMTSDEYGNSTVIFLTNKQKKRYKKKGCYVRMRAYVYDGYGNKEYGDWGDERKIKIK